jgi:hypothetical protein
VAVVSRERNKKGDQTQRTRGGGLVAVVSRERKQKGDQTERTPSGGSSRICPTLWCAGVVLALGVRGREEERSESVLCYLVYTKWM